MDVTVLVEHLRCWFVVAISVTGVSVMGLNISILIVILVRQELRNTILLYQISIIATTVAHVSLALFLPVLQPLLEAILLYYVLQLLATIVELIFKRLPSGPFISWNCTTLIKVVWHWSLSFWSSWQLVSEEHVLCFLEGVHHYSEEVVH